MSPFASSIKKSNLISFNPKAKGSNFTSTLSVSAKVLISLDHSSEILSKSASGLPGTTFIITPTVAIMVPRGRTCICSSVRSFLQNQNELLFPCTSGREKLQFRLR